MHLLTPRTYSLLSARAALGDDERTEEECRCALQSGVSAGSVREIFLQSYLFLGYPRAINALSALNRTLESLGRDPMEGHPSDLERPETDVVRQRGESLCARIYGPVYASLRRRMAALHPLLERWMIEEGYGRVLSRANLAPREREFGVVGALVVLGVEPQLESHVRGALRVGASIEETQTAVSSPAGIVDRDKSEIAMRTLLRVLSSWRFDSQASGRPTP